MEILIFCTGDPERRYRLRGRGVVKYWNRRFHVEAMLSPGNANWTPWAIPGGPRLLLEDGSSSRRDTFSRVNYRPPRPYYYLKTEPRRAEAISGFISPTLTRTIPIRDCQPAAIFLNFWLNKKQHLDLLLPYNSIILSRNENLDQFRGILGLLKSFVRILRERESSICNIFKE